MQSDSLSMINTLITSVLNRTVQNLSNLGVCLIQNYKPPFHRIFGREKNFVDVCIGGPLSKDVLWQLTFDVAVLATWAWVFVAKNKNSEFLLEVLLRGKKIKTAKNHRMSCYHWCRKSDTEPFLKAKNLLHTGPISCFDATSLSLM